MQQPNLSERNAFFRFVMGTSMTALGIAKSARDSDSLSGKLMITLGAMKMAEGIFKYCPTKAMLNTNMQSAMTTTMQSMFNGQNSITPENITKLMQDFSSTFATDQPGSNQSNNQNTSASNQSANDKTNNQNTSNTTTDKSSNQSTNNQNTSNNKNSANNAQNPS